MLKDVLFPKRCLNCKKLGSYICLDCQKGLIYIAEDRCIYCKKASYLGFTHPMCLKKEGLDGVLSIFLYNNILKNIIKAIKYKLVKDAWSEFLSVIDVAKLEKFYRFRDVNLDCLLEPIPLHPLKLNKRGFNQSQLFSQYLARILSFEQADLLLRVKNTPPQAQLMKNKRYSNIRGAFSSNPIKPIPLNYKVILVDDLITTGHTILEATRVLKKAGAERVFAFSLAAG